MGGYREEGRNRLVDDCVERVVGATFIESEFVVVDEFPKTFQVCQQQGLVLGTLPELVLCGMQVLLPIHATDFGFPPRADGGAGSCLAVVAFLEPFAKDELFVISGLFRAGVGLIVHVFNDSCGDWPGDHLHAMDSVHIHAMDSVHIVPRLGKCVRFVVLALVMVTRDGLRESGGQWGQ